MDRPITYMQALAADTDTLNMAKFAMVGLAELSQAVLGTSTQVVGLSATPGVGLNLAIGAGAVYQMNPIDATAYGSLTANATSVLKQGLLISGGSVSVPAPTVSGQSINYLIEVAQEDVDAGATVLSFFNPNGGNPLQGPNGNNQPSNTIRTSIANVVAKAGVAAATGSQTTPAVDAGYVALYVVTVAYGQTSLTQGNISTVSGAPFLTETLPQKISAATASSLIATAIAPLATTAALAAAVAPLATTAALTAAQTALNAAITAAVAPLATTAALNAAVSTIDAAIALLAPITAPNFLGVPTAPTAAAGTNTQQLATCAFVNASVGATNRAGNVSNTAGPWWSWDPITGEVHIRGFQSQVVTSESTITVSFPINIGTFQTGQATTVQNSTAGATVAQIDTWTTTSMTIVLNDNAGNSVASANGFMWEAWGYSPTKPVSAS